MPRTYFAPFDFTYSTAKTVCLIQSSSAVVLEILSIRVKNADVETNEQMKVAVTRVTSLGSPTGTNVTPTKGSPGDAASVATVTVNLTAEPTTYATVNLDLQGDPSLSGYQWVSIPEERVFLAPSGALGIRVRNNMSSFNLVGKVSYQELG